MTKIQICVKKYSYVAHGENIQICGNSHEKYRFAETSIKKRHVANGAKHSAKGGYSKSLHRLKIKNTDLWQKGPNIQICGNRHEKGRSVAKKTDLWQLQYRSQKKSDLHKTFNICQDWSPALIIMFLCMHSSWKSACNLGQ